MTPEERKKYGGMVRHKAGDVVNFDSCTFGTIIYNSRTKQVGVMTHIGILVVYAQGGGYHIGGGGYHIGQTTVKDSEAKKDQWVSFGVNLGGVLKRIEDTYNAK